MKNEYQTEIINKIKRLREENGYSQVKIASLLGISHGQMGNIESIRCSHKYTLEHIYTICTEFNISIEHIFLEDADYSNNKDIIKTLIFKIIQYEK
ncbi:helix-turn-helix transcriptional regulator [Bacteroides sp.]